MRSADASGFTIDPTLLATPRFAVLSACDLGGLLCLWAAAWAEGGRLPADDRQLAALSRLGPSWGASGVAGALARFFRKEGDHLVATDLEAQLARREQIRSKRRAAGKASADSRATRVQQVFNTCSANVQHVLPAGQEGGREGGQAAPPRKPRKSRAKVQLAPTLGAAGAGSAGTQDCTEHSPEMPPAYDCPPAPPIERDLSNLNLSEGGAGGGCQLDLFGQVVPPPKARSASGGRPNVTDAMLAEAEGLIDGYMDSVRPLWPRSGAAKNVAHWLANGYTIDQLRRAVSIYAEYAESVGMEARFRKKPSNFFGVQGDDTGYFKTFLTRRPEREPRQPQGGVVGGGTRIRQKGREYYDNLPGTINICTDEAPAAAGGGALPQDQPADDGNPFLALARDRAAGGG